MSRFDFMRHYGPYDPYKQIDRGRPQDSGKADWWAAPLGILLGVGMFVLAATVVRVWS